MVTELQNPVLVEVTRGDLVESFHTGAVAVVDAAGCVVSAWGDIERCIYPRSAIKPIQALPLIESGAADHFGLGDTEIALACASHSGECRHVSAVEQWLERVGLGVDDLECGVHRPLDADADTDLIGRHQDVSSLHNNCSGKHAGFLTTALHLGHPTKSYIGPDHPVQIRVRAVLEEMTDTALRGAPTGVDGCGIPVIGLSLRATARAMALLANPQGLAPARRAAAQRVIRAMAEQPFMVAGSQRICTKVIQATQGAAIIKTGAEGVFTAALPIRGLGIALKMDDGSKRAADVAITALLCHLEVFDQSALALIAEYLEPPIRNHAGVIVGRERAAPSLMPSTLERNGRTPA